MKRYNESAAIAQKGLNAMKNIFNTKCILYIAEALFAFHSIHIEFKSDIFLNSIYPNGVLKIYHSAVVYRNLRCIPDKCVAVKQCRINIHKNTCFKCVYNRTVDIFRRCVGDPTVGFLYMVCTALSSRSLHSLFFLVDANTSDRHFLKLFLR